MLGSIHIHMQLFQEELPFKKIKCQKEAIHKIQYLFATILKIIQIKNNVKIELLNRKEKQFLNSFL